MKLASNRILLTIFKITLGLCLASTVSFAEHHEKATHPAKSAAAPAVKPAAAPAGKAAAKPATAVQPTPAAKSATVIKFDAKEVNGAKVWLPKDSTAKVGEPVTLEVHNSLTAPHGFKIDGYVPATDIGAGETKSFTFTPKAKGVLKVMCHLHPAHVGAEIKVQ
jgi:plastocyanin